MQDIAVSINATYFSEKTGDDLSLMTEEDLGHCAKVIVGRDSTVIIKEDEPNKDAIKERVAQLRVAIENTKLKADKEFILSRIASLTGGVGVIYVGGNTDLEQKELYDRVDDAVCAVRSALEEGILPGGGLALFREALEFSDGDLNSKKHIQMLYDALQAPLLQIWENAGEKYENGVFKDTDIFSGGYDVKNDKFGCMYDMGIIDPLKVTKCALQNAVSVAVTLLSTNAIITMARTYEDKN